MVPISSSSSVILFKKFLSHKDNVLDATLEDCSSLGVFFVLSLFFCKPLKNYLIMHKRPTIFYVRFGINLIVAQLITCVGYVVVHSYVPVNACTVFFGLLCTSFLLFATRYLSTKTNDSVAFNFYTSCMLGSVQAIALLPGISRLTTTFIAARLLGFSTTNAFAISWLLIAPLHLAQGMYAFSKLFLWWPAELLQMQWWLTMLFSGLCAYMFLWLTYCAVRGGRMWYFGIYTFILAFVTLFLW